MSKNTPAVGPTHLTVNRLSPSGRIADHHPLTRIECNKMCNNILNILNNINEISGQYDNTELSIITGHNWEHILQPLVNLGADPDSIDL